MDLAALVSRYNELSNSSDQTERDNCMKEIVKIFETAQAKNAAKYEKDIANINSMVQLITLLNQFRTRRT